MKSVLILNSILTILFLSPIVLNAQETADELFGSITNKEPSHAYYILGEKSRSPLDLVQISDDPVRYQHSFRFQPRWTGKQVLVRICGINTPFHLKINGFKYGLGDGQGIPMEFNITPFLKQEMNVIELNFDQTANNHSDDLVDLSTLIIREPVHVRDLEVTSYSRPENPETIVRVHLFIQSFLTGQNRGRTLSVIISDPDGDTISTHEKTIDFPLAFRQEVELTIDQNIDNPRLWSPDNPELYNLQVHMVEKDKTEGELVSATFGIRSATFEDSILVINQDTLAPVIAPKAIIKHINDLSDEEILNRFKEMNSNVVQSNNYLPARVMDLFDRNGIVVLKKQEEHDPEKDRPDINRPSIVWIK